MLKKHFSVYLSVISCARFGVVVSLYLHCLDSRRELTTQNYLEISCPYLILPGVDSGDQQPHSL